MISKLPSCKTSIKAEFAQGGCPAAQEWRERWPDGQHGYAPSHGSKTCRTLRDSNTSRSCSFPAPITDKLLLNYWAMVHRTPNLKPFSLPDYSQSDHTSNKSPGTIQTPAASKSLFFVFSSIYNSKTFLKAGKTVMQFSALFLALV